MATTVPAQTSARQPKLHSTEFQLSELSLVSATVIHGVTGLDLAWTVVVILILVVAFPAARPGKLRYRRAGLDVLGCLLP